jgi:hypothetical protein
MSSAATLVPAVPDAGDPTELRQQRAARAVVTYAVSELGTTAQSLRLHLSRIDGSPNSSMIPR